MMDNIIVEIVTENIPYKEITEVLHYAYAEHLKHNLSYQAAEQDWIKTKERIGDGGVIIARDADRIIGTLVFKTITGGKKWYQDGTYLSLNQFAVLPAYRNKNVVFPIIYALKKYMDTRQNISKTIFTTSVEAEKLVASYVKSGAQIVDFVSWPNTSYYSYVFVAHNGKEKYPEDMVNKRLKRSKFKCKLIFKANGQRTVFGKILSKIKKEGS